MIQLVSFLFFSALFLSYAPAQTPPPGGVIGGVPSPAPHTGEMLPFGKKGSSLDLSFGVHYKPDKENPAADFGKVFFTYLWPITRPPLDKVLKDMNVGMEYYNSLGPRNRMLYNEELQRRYYDQTFGKRRLLITRSDGLLLYGMARQFTENSSSFHGVVFRTGYAFHGDWISQPGESNPFLAEKQKKRYKNEGYISLGHKQLEGGTGFQILDLFTSKVIAEHNFEPVKVFPEIRARFNWDESQKPLSFTWEFSKQYAFVRTFLSWDDGETWVSFPLEGGDHRDPSGDRQPFNGSFTFKQTVEEWKYLRSQGYTMPQILLVGTINLQVFYHIYRPVEREEPNARVHSMGTRRDSPFPPYLWGGNGNLSGYWKRDPERQQPFETIQSW